MPDPIRPDRPSRPEPAESRRDWEDVQTNKTDKTERLRIVGGWLYRVLTETGGIALVHVPAHADDE